MLNMILLSSFVGGLTGIISHLIRNKGILIYPEKSQQPKGVYLGFLSDILISAAAAVFATTYLVLNAGDVKTIVGISILAGMSAENILLRREIKNTSERSEALDRINKRLTK